MVPLSHCPTRKSVSQANDLEGQEAPIHRSILGSQDVCLQHARTCGRIPYGIDCGCADGPGQHAEIRKVIYTTNAVESLNMSLRKVIKTGGSFPSEEAAIKLLYLALEHIAKRWTQPLQDWKGALNRFAILLEDRLPKSVLA